MTIRLRKGTTPIIQGTIELIWNFLHLLKAKDFQILFTMIRFEYSYLTYTMSNALSLTSTPKETI
jgi:hypothetical protein